MTEAVKCVVVAAEPAPAKTARSGPVMGKNYQPTSLIPGGGSGPTTSPPAPRKK